MVTTEKDAVRCEGFTSGKIPLWVVLVKPEFLGDDEQKFEEFLSFKLGRKWMR